MFNSSFLVFQVKVETLVTEEELISRSKEFEAAIKDPGSKYPLRDLCERKAEETGYVFQLIYLVLNISQILGDHVMSFCF